MALTGILAGYNEQRGHDVNYLAQLDAMRRAQAAQELDQQRMRQQAEQAAQEMQFRQEQADQAAQMRDSQMMRQSMQDQRQRLSNMGQESYQLAQQQRQAGARNALADLVSRGDDVSMKDLGRAVLPFDPNSGINLLKQSREEERQQALLERTGGTGVSAPRGYRWTKEGNLEYIPGGESDPSVIAQLEGIKSAYKAKEPKPLTEVQGNAVGFGMRAAKSHDIINDLEARGVKTGSLIKQGLESVPLIGGALGMAANSLVASPEQQQVEQSQRDFVNALLRKESGASISPTEFENARKQYFAQPGDSPEVLAQKRANRETAIEALRVQAGPGAENIKRGNEEPAKSQQFNSLPDPRQYNGKIVRDTETGTRWMSNGRDWVRAQ